MGDIKPFLCEGSGWASGKGILQKKTIAADLQQIASLQNSTATFSKC
jgi:hypothetical protein